MSIATIDLLTKNFYDSISFKTSIVPDITSLHAIFHGAGLMINNTPEIPRLYTAESFVQDLESQIAEEEITQFLKRELYSKTEIFGKVAQRLSVYEYNTADHELERLPRGINFIQYVMIDGNWSITSMAWNDENEEYQVPVEYLGRGS